MAVPTIASLTPNAGPSGGLTYVTVLGTGFRLPPAPPPTGRVGKPAPTVRITVGGRPAKAVAVLSDTQLFFVAPPGDAGARDVVVQNIAATGASIPGEAVTAAAAFTFRRPNLAAEGYLQYVVRMFTLELRRQLLENTVSTTHTDYDDATGDGLNTVAVAKLPAVVLVGPQTAENRFFSENVTRYLPRADGSVAVLAVGYTVDLMFDVLLLADTQQELLNLSRQATRFVDRNDYLRVPIDAADLSKGTLDYEFDFAEGGDFSSRDLLSLSNVRQHAGRVVIRGVVLDEDDPVVGTTFAVTGTQLGIDIVGGAVEVQPFYP